MSSCCVFTFDLSSLEYCLCIVGAAGLPGVRGKRGERGPPGVRGEMGLEGRRGPEGKQVGTQYLCVLNTSFYLFFIQ